MALSYGIELPGRPDLENVRNLDRLPIPMLRTMQRVGFAVDVDYLKDLGLMLSDDMKDLRKDITSYVPQEKLEQFVAKSVEIEAENGDITINPASAEQVRELLFTDLGVGRERELKLTKKKEISTGKKQLELVKEDHPVVKLILDYRERAKLKTTYCDSLPKIARFHPRSKGKNFCPLCGRHHNSDTWRAHSEFTTTRAATGRLASKSPNLTNIPTRTELGAMVRAAFTCEEGYILVSNDFSQIELRDLAHCANAKSMIDVYQEDKDIHIFTACAAFGLDYNFYSDLTERPKKSLTPDEKSKLDYFKQYCRMPSKNLNFMIVYGATVVGLLAQLALSGLLWTEEEGNNFIDRWFNLYPEVREYMDLQCYRARRYGLVWDLFGRIRLIPEVSSFHRWIQEAGLRQAGNLPIQSFAAGQLKITLAKVYDQIKLFQSAGFDVWPLVPVHDQIIVESPEKDAYMVDAAMKESFNNVMWDEDREVYACRVPIKCDGEITTRWVKD